MDTPGGIESVVNIYRESIFHSDAYVSARLLNYFFKPSKDFELRQIKIFVTSAIFDSSLLLCDVYKQCGIPFVCRLPLIRRDVFDLIVITQHSQKWTDERTLFVQHYYPHHPIPGRGTICLPGLDQCPPADGQLDMSFLSQSFDVQLRPSFVSQSSHDLSVISQSSDGSQLDLSVISSQSSDGSQLDISGISRSMSYGSHNTKSRVSRVSKLKHTINTGIYKHGRRGKTLFWQDVLSMADKDNHLVDSLAGVLRNHTRRNSRFA